MLLNIEDIGGRGSVRRLDPSGKIKRAAKLRIIFVFFGRHQEVCCYHLHRLE